MIVVKPPAPPRVRPLVSVVVPCYNYGHYLPQAVGSILGQDGVDVEVIVVDDHSTDGSEQVAARLAEAHPQVRVIRNAVNKRHIATYNVGLAEARGDYVVLLSADDMLATGALARATALMEAHPEVGLVYGVCTEFTDAPEPARPATNSSLWSGREWIAAVARRGDNPVVNPEVVIRGSVMRTLVGYDPQFPHAADLLLWLQAAALADVGRVNGVQAHYRTHPRQMHLNDYAGILTDMREREAVYRAFFTGHAGGADLAGATGMLQDALKSTAGEAVWRGVLADSGGAGDTAESGAFAEFAQQADPGITRSALWRELQRRRDGRRPLIPDAAIRTAYRLKWIVKWRLWQWRGL